MNREEAIKTVRNIYQTDREKEALETLIPELRDSENEDERMINEIIHTVTGYHPTHTTEEIDSMVAYLEKQKGVLSERASNIAANMLEDGIEGVQRELIEFLSNTVNASWVDVIKSADAYAERIRNIIEKLKEQKPNYCHHEVDETGWTEEYRKAYYDGWNNCNMQHSQLQAEQMPAEWSEEDELMIQCCITALSYYENNAKRGILPAQFDIAGYLTTPERVVDWLKSLPNRFALQPKQEWSVEDEALIENVCTALKGYALHERKVDLDEHAHRLEEMSERLKFLRPQPKAEWSEEDERAITEIVCVLSLAPMNAERSKELCNWIQHLRPRPHWTPSDEQMEALEHFIELWGATDSQLGYVKIYGDVKKLYEQLKAL